MQDVILMNSELPHKYDVFSISFLLNKKGYKDKTDKVFDIFRESVAFIASVFLLLIMAYGKDTSSFYHLNTAVKNDFLKSKSPNFTSIKTRDQWFDWTMGPFLQSLHSHYIMDGLDSKKVI